MGKGKVLLATATVLGMTFGVAMADIPEDHKDITGPFATPMDVTNTCLECHDTAAQEVMQTSHWTWATEQVIEGRTVMRGKKTAINNFCISISGGQPRCTSCHVGYGWKDTTFDFSDESRVDCLACHDTTGIYNKQAGAPAGAGMPPGYTGNKKFDAKPYDLERMAQRAGVPSRQNCLNCHANGGGGNAIKHGDMDISLMMPDPEVDIHMADEGNDFACQECHVTDEHKIRGNALVVSPGLDDAVTCASCHTEEPHKKSRLNKHVARVACQTCHIPVFAKEYPTKMSWDWSTAQNPKNLPEDKRVIKEDGHVVYTYMKGDFHYEKNVTPEYYWYNGSGGAYTVGDKIDPEKVTKLNFPLGSKDDPDSKIAPFKVHHGNQPYDVKNKYFITPKLFGGPDGFWVAFDWKKAAAAGMKETGLPFSGEVGFAKTETYWPINHMVASKDEALKCTYCHGKSAKIDWVKLGYEGDPRQKK